MHHLSRLLPLLLIGTSPLRGCDDQRPPGSILWLVPAPKAETHADHGPPAPVTTEEPPARIPPPPNPGQLGYHRYVGTLGAEPVVLELTVEPLDRASPADFECRGSYYELRTGQEHYISAAGRFWPGSALELDAGSALAGRTDFWCAEQPLGPVLTGINLRGGQVPRPFRLSESYAGAVRYEIVEEECRERPGLDYWGEPDSAFISLDYLHLLGADTARPALARLQCPPPARRRQACRTLAAQLTPTPADMAAVYTRSRWVTLNEAGLLAYQQEDRQSVVRKRYELSRESRSRLLDLRTGRQLNILAQLRPGSLATIRRQLTRQAQADTSAYAHGLIGANGLIPLPEDGFALTPAGWQVWYNTGDQSYPYESFTGRISWAELGPLLRPGSPLQRIVRARSRQRPGTAYR